MSENLQKSLELKALSVRAYVNLSLTNWADVIRDCGEIIRINPDFVKAYYLRGTAYHMLDQGELALSDLNSALEKETTNREARVSNTYSQSSTPASSI